MRNLITCLLLIFFAVPAWAQAPVGDYTELEDSRPRDTAAKWDAQKAPVQLQWGSTDVRYAKWNVPAAVSAVKWTTRAWRGERVNAQAVLWTARELGDLAVSVSDLRSGREVIPASAAEPHFVRYVMTDELNKNGRGTCGHRPDRTLFDSSLVADVLDPAVLLRMEARSARPVWLTVSVPRDARPGKYTGTLTVTANGIAPLHLPFGIEVLDHTLPAPGQWAFHLDLWQHPYAVARLYGVPLWSEEHFEIMRPMMRRLAAAGQKVVTATIMHRPWAGQSYDVYPSMVAKKKCLDGSWQYDYTVFDRWIEFMEEMGIGEQINCFTMIPWALEFDYFDQATSSVQFIKAAPGEAAYEAYWLPFLKDFARHLRTKGWFGHTTISMDEREQDAMLHTIALIRKADPDFKISFQGNKGGHYPAIESEIYDLSMAFNHPLPAEVLAARHAAGKVTTVYTCCSESRPNLFTFSPPAEGAWLPWFAVASGYDGYLRWAYANWNADPLRDSRFRSWGGGDCYIVYPERSSIRMERLVEGIQDAEKIRILRTALTAAGKTRQLAELNAAVAQFKAADLTETNAGEMVARGRETLNKL